MPHHDPLAFRAAAADHAIPVVAVFPDEDRARLALARTGARRVGGGAPGVLLLDRGGERDLGARLYAAGATLVVD